MSLAYKQEVCILEHIGKLVSVINKGTRNYLQFISKIYHDLAAGKFILVIRKGDAAGENLCCCT